MSHKKVKAYFPLLYICFCTPRNKHPPPSPPPRHPTHQKGFHCFFCRSYIVYITVLIPMCTTCRKSRSTLQCCAINSKSSFIFYLLFLLVGNFQRGWILHLSNLILVLQLVKKDKRIVISKDNDWLFRRTYINLKMLQS